LADDRAHERAVVVCAIRAPGARVIERADGVDQRRQDGVGRAQVA
jgi:hypothetical protein